MIKKLGFESNTSHVIIKFNKKSECNELENQGNATVGVEMSVYTTRTDFVIQAIVCKCWTYKFLSLKTGIHLIEIETNTYHFQNNRPVKLNNWVLFYKILAGSQTQLYY